VTDSHQIVDRRLGWVPPAPHVVPSLKFAGIKASAKLYDVDVPDAVDLSDRVQIVDQGQLGSCVANADMQIIHAEMEPGAEFPSRLWGYQLALAEQGTEGQDVGTNLATCFDAIASHGFPRERHWPYDPAALGQRPSPSAWRLAHDQRDVARVDYHQISGDVIGLVKAALAAGHLVAFGTRVDDNFCSNILQPVIEPPMVADTVGGHALTISGYQTTPFGVIYQIANSWGPGWGNGGFCWFSEDYLTAAYSGDFWFCSSAPAYSDEVTP
jgi:C1A family cysteine protease